MTEDQLKEHAAAITRAIGVPPSGHYVGGILRTFCARVGISIEPSKPVVRPYTPVEAAAHIGRGFHDGTGRGYIILRGVAADGIGSQWGEWTFDKFAKTCTWADDSSPCGIVT